MSRDSREPPRPAMCKQEIPAMADGAGTPHRAPRSARSPAARAVSQIEIPEPDTCEIVPARAAAIEYKIKF